jgi:hypothetical protein
MFRYREISIATIVKKVDSLFFFSEKYTGEPGVLVHTCNPSYLGGGGKKIKSLRPAYTKY